MDFQTVISYEKLYLAHRRARLGKRHKKEVILFEANLSQNLWDLHYQLKYGKYQISGYNKFMIYDPKEREVQAISYKDRVVQHALCDNYLIPTLDKYLIYDNVACRVGMGSSKAISRLRNFMTSYYKKHGRSGYFVKIDVRKYFANISHTLLKEKLKKVLFDKDCLNLLFSLIDSFNFDEDKGLPIGNQSSQYLALFYLNDLDRFFKERLKVKYYLRYMDDIIMIVDDKNFASRCICEANKLLLKERLTLNPKSQAIPIKNGVEFLGWRFSFGNTGKVIQKLKKSAKSRILKKVKTLKYTLKLVPKSNERKLCSWVSYRGLLQKGCAYNFLDKIGKILKFHENNSDEKKCG